MNKSDVKSLLEGGDVSVVGMADSYIQIESKGKFYSVDVNRLLDAVNKLYLQYNDEDAINLLADDL